MYLASQLGFDGILRALLESAARVQINNARVSNGFCALHAATQCGHTNVIVTLLENGAEADKRVQDGATALYIAAQEGLQK